MFDFFRKHTRVLQFLLVILIFPSFVFFGIQGYSGFTGDANDSVAKVAGQSITRTEWEAAQRDQMERVRQQMPNVDAKMFDTPEMKLQSLDGLVRQRVMLAAADKLNLVTTDDRLQRVFAADSQFAFMRNPDGSINKDVLSAQGMSSEMFAQRLRQDLTLRQVMLGVSGTAIAPASTTAAALDAMFQQREVQVQRFETKTSLEKVSPKELAPDYAVIRDYLTLFATFADTKDANKLAKLANQMSSEAVLGRYFDATVRVEAFVRRTCGFPVGI